MAYETLLLERIGNRAGAIAIVTLNRPDKMNAFTAQMTTDLLHVLDVLDDDDTVRAIIFTGAGRAFCAGMDLSPNGNVFGLDESIDPHGTDMERNRDLGGKVVLRLYRMKKPVIGAINGAAVGVGATMQLPMDRRIASLDAKFGFVFAQRGITLESCASWFLPRLVGIETALDWSMSGRVFEALEAQEAGLISHVVPADKLMDAAMTAAESYITNTSPMSVAINRQLIWRMMGSAHPMDAHRAESRTMMHTSMHDGKEGVASFLEKRAPVFQDKVSGGVPYGLDMEAEPEFFEGDS